MVVIVLSLGKRHKPCILLIRIVQYFYTGFLTLIIANQMTFLWSENMTHDYRNKDQPIPRINLIRIMFSLKAPR